MYTCKTEAITLGSSCFCFQIISKDNNVHTDSISPCFFQKFGSWLSDAEPSRTLNAAFYFNFPNTVKMFLYHEYKSIDFSLEDRC